MCLFSPYTLFSEVALPGSERSSLQQNGEQDRKAELGCERSSYLIALRLA